MGNERSDAIARLIDQMSDAEKRQLDDKYAAIYEAYIKERNDLGKIKSMHNLHASVDVSAKPERRDMKASCSKGCAFCCYILVDITKSEAEILKPYVTEDMLPKLRRQGGRREVEEWKELPYAKRKCVFLTDKNECGVYDNRPTACRKYFVQSDPADCSDADGVVRMVETIFDWASEIMYGIQLKIDKHETMADGLLRLIRRDGFFKVIKKANNETNKENVPREQPGPSGSLVVVK